MTGQRRALIVAIDEYDHAELGQLPSAAADAEALARVLGDPGIGRFDVRVLRNDQAHRVREEIEDFFAEAAPDDLLLLHFSGHGLKSDAGELFFSAGNTRPTRLRSTAVPSDFVQQCMRTSRSRSIVLFLDCCYGGAFEQGAQVRAGGDVNVLDAFPQERLGGRGRVVITSCGSSEFAFEGDRLSDRAAPEPSVFTGALVHGLATGDADRDEDGWISLGELYEYLYERVRSITPKQTPTRGGNVQGELYLARSGRHRVRPQPIPGELRSALADGNMYARIGAITELRKLVLSANVALAAGAVEALAAIRDADLPHVADQARDALAVTRPRPERSQVPFGRLAQGRGVPHQRVSLSGPPIARACTVRSTDDRVRATVDDGTVEVWIDTASPGPVAAAVVLTGAGGQASIDVSAVVALPETRESRSAVSPTEPAPLIEPEPLREPEPSPNPSPAPPPGPLPVLRPESSPLPSPGPMPAPLPAPRPESERQPRPESLPESERQPRPKTLWQPERRPQPESSREPESSPEREQEGKREREPAGEDRPGARVPANRNGLRGFLAKRVWTVVGVLLFTVAAAVAALPLIADALVSTPPPNRVVDAKPLSIAEVFPVSPVTVPSGASYTVEEADADTDCRRIGTGDLGTALRAAGCTQYVRATLATADRKLLVTAGIANLESEPAAEAVHRRLGTLEAPFSGLTTQASTAPISGNGVSHWVVYGHYLVFCKIVNATGVSAEQPEVQSVMKGLIRDYLAGEVLHERNT